MNHERVVTKIIKPAHKKFGLWHVIVGEGTCPVMRITLSFRTEEAARRVGLGYQLDSVPA